MRLFEATNKATGMRYFYSVRRVFGRKQYTADCTSACAAPGAEHKPTWHQSLSEARQAAAARGTLERVA